MSVAQKSHWGPIYCFMKQPVQVTLVSHLQDEDEHILGRTELSPHGLAFDNERNVDRLVQKKKAKIERRAKSLEENCG